MSFNIQSLDCATQIRLGLRVAQFGASFLALVTVAAGFRSAGSTFGQTSMLGSHATNFALLMTYTAVLYTLYDTLAIEIFKITVRPSRVIQLAIDAAFTAILFITALLLVTSDYVTDCDSYAGFVRCGSLTAGTIFTFVATLAFAASVALPFVGNRFTTTTAAKDDADVPEAIPYNEESTPKGPAALSPIGAGQSPSNKV